ncbi:MAG TPA: alpha/beta hydrolase [Dehalococcoidia bacterium]|nr:alpha/beta hydrolase [Dehalococcoidia bacterium]
MTTDRASRTPDARPEPVEGRGTVRANGIDIYYELHGPKNGIPLVMTHGFAGPTDCWRDEPLALSEERPLLLYDVRGHGHTEVPPDLGEYSMPTYAADLAALLEALGIQRAHIGGVSMGGMVAAQFAVDHPQLVESLLLCDTTAGNTTGDDPAGQWEQRIARGLTMLSYIARESGLEETIRREHEYNREHDPRWDIKPNRPEMDYERIRMMTLPGYLGAAKAITGRPDLTPRLHEITAPTLVMIGEWDDFLPCALRDHKLIRGSRLVVRKECAHGSCWRPDTFRRAVSEFLADVEAGRPVAGEFEG